MGKHDNRYLTDLVMNCTRHGQRTHGDIEQTQRCDRGEIRYVTQCLSKKYLYGGDLASVTWYRVGVGIFQPVTPR